MIYLRGSLTLLLILVAFSLNVGDTRAESVPEFLYLTEDQAVKLAEQAGFKLQIEHKPSAEPMGQVYDQFPARGLDAPDQRAVIFISDGVETPRALGLPLDDVIKTLSENGLRHFVTRVSVEGFLPGIVARQVPPPGDHVDVGTTSIYLTVSTGTVSVPDVKEMLITDAIGEIESVGLVANPLTPVPEDPVVVNTDRCGNTGITRFVAGEISPEAGSIVVLSRPIQIAIKQDDNVVAGDPDCDPFGIDVVK